MTRPPLPPVARIPDHEPARPTIVGEEFHTLPGWVAALIYLACTVVLGWVIFDRMLPGVFG